MTEALQRAIDAISLLPASEQDALAGWLLTVLESEKKWSELFAKSPDLIASLAQEALDEHARGETRSMDSK